MSEALGLAIGTTNLVAARPDGAAVSRRAVLTLWEGRPAEVGVPSQNPELTSPNLGEAGLVLRGFVERVGDPVPLVAADGSAHRGESLVAVALEAMARTVDDGRAPATVTVAVPAHWGPATVGALRGALRGAPALAPAGLPPTIVSDAAAALTALQADPGLPTSGVVALCDFGGSGSSISLADAGAALAPIGETVRYGDFSGDLIDQVLLNHVLAGARAAGHLDPSGTAAVGGLTRLRAECRLAKERLSSDIATVVPIDLPGYRAEVRLTRTELEGLIADPFTGFLDALGDALERNRIPASRLAAVATVGGGAAIPVINQRLSEDLRAPVVTTPLPGATAAVGAAILAARGTASDAPTGLAPTAADAPTGLAPAAWAVGAAGQAATESASDGSPSATYRALAWSQDDESGGEPVPYTGDEYYPPVPSAPPTGPRPAVEYEPEDDGTVLLAGPLPWYRRPPLLFGIAAAVAALSVGGLAIKLTSSDSTPTTTTTRVTKPGEAPSTPTVVAPQTITVTGSNGEPTVTTVTPPPPTTTAPSTEATTTTTTPTTTTTTTTPTTTTTTTTTTPTTTTTTTTPTTTRTTTTTTTTTTVPTTGPETPPPTTAAPPVTTTAVPPPTTQAPPPTTPAPPPTTQALITTTIPPLPTLKPAPSE